MEAAEAAWLGWVHGNDIAGPMHALRIEITRERTAELSRPADDRDAKVLHGADNKHLRVTSTGDYHCEHICQTRKDRDATIASLRIDYSTACEERDLMRERAEQAQDDAMLAMFDARDRLREAMEAAGE